MASLDQITRIVLGLVPEKDRKKMETFAQAMVNEAALSILGAVPWWWRRVYKEVSVASTDTDFDMPAEFERFSTENMVVVDSSGIPLAIINFIGESRYNEYVIEDDERYNNDYPLFYTIRAKNTESRTQTVYFLGSPTTSFTVRLFGYRFPSINDVSRLTNGMAVAFLAATMIPGVEETDKLYQLYAKELKRMEERNMVDEDEMLVLEMDDRAFEANTRIRNVQERR